LNQTNVPQFLKIREANKIFRIGLNTLYSAIQTEELRAFRPNGRDLLIKSDDIISWIEKSLYKKQKKAN
jgi:excisionase family DNA binding protein